MFNASALEVLELRIAFLSQIIIKAVGAEDLEKKISPEEFKLINGFAKILQNEEELKKKVESIEQASKLNEMLGGMFGGPDSKPFTGFTNDINDTGMVHSKKENITDESNK